MKADLDAWKATGNQPSTAEVMAATQRWDQACNLTQVPTTPSFTHDFMCKLGCPIVCGGSGSTVINWRWHLTSQYSDLDISIPDPLTSGSWAAAQNDVGAGVQVGHSKGTLGGTTLGVWAATIQFGPIVLPASGGISPNCTHIPLIGYVSTYANYSFTAAMPDVLTSILGLSGDGTLCTIPC